MSTSGPPQSNYSFTDGVRLALAQARMAAQEYRHGWLTPEHILLGLVGATRDRDIKRLLSALDIQAAQLEHELRDTFELGTSQMGLGELPYDPEAKAMLERAMVLSTEYGHSSVGIDHVFAALSESTREPLHSIFLKHGISASAVVEKLIESRKR